jgi:hypothetical protein
MATFPSDNNDDVGEIDDVIQAYVESEEEELGRPLTEKEREEIVKFCSPEEQDDYEPEDNATE